MTDGGGVPGRRGVVSKVRLNRSKLRSKNLYIMMDYMKKSSITYLLSLLALIVIAGCATKEEKEGDIYTKRYVPKQNQYYMQMQQLGVTVTSQSKKNPENLSVQKKNENADLKIIDEFTYQSSNSNSSQQEEIQNLSNDEFQYFKNRYEIE